LTDFEVKWPYLTGRTGRGVTTVSTNILSPNGTGNNTIFNCSLIENLRCVYPGKGRYSACINDERIKFGILGEGNTVEETIEDFKIGYEEMKETYLAEGKDFQELEFDFKYDTASFLSAYSTILSLAGMSRLTGLNQ